MLTNGQTSIFQKEEFKERWIFHIHSFNPTTEIAITTNTDTNTIHRVIEDLGSEKHVESFSRRFNKGLEA